MVGTLSESPHTAVVPAGGAASEWTRGRLLILNVRGFQRADPLYRELAALGWKTTVLDVDEPALLRRYAFARSFHPSLARWRRRFERTANRLARTAFVFRYKSRLYGRLIQRAGVPCDVILQGGGLFAPGWPPPATPYAVLCDCTVKLGEGEPLSGVEFASQASAARWYALEGWLYRNAGCVFSASGWATRSLIEHYGVDPTQAVTVGEGCSLEAADGPTKRYDGRTILYVGYEFQRKGGEVLLEAFKQVRAAIPDAQLLIAGPRRTHGRLPQGASLIGPAPRQELAQLYNRASLFVMPSLFEPFGLTFLEAMEHKLPCIGSDRCAIPEIIVDGETGLLSPVGDARVLAEKIVYLLRRPETMRAMGARGHARGRTFFTWDAVARRIDGRLINLLHASTALGIGRL